MAIKYNPFPQAFLTQCINIRFKILIQLVYILHQRPLQRLARFKFTVRNIIILLHSNLKTLDFFSTSFLTNRYFFLISFDNKNETCNAQKISFLTKPKTH